MNFKIGDKVRCIDIPYTSDLSRERLYEIDKVGNNVISIKDADKHRGCWYISRFQKIEIGDNFRYIGPAVPDRLTVDKIYTLFYFLEDSYITVIADDGYQHSHVFKDFEKVEDGINGLNPSIIIFDEYKCEEKPKAARYNSGKVQFHQIPLLGLVEVGKVATMGGAKYECFNFKGKCSYSQYFDCDMRHKLKDWYGQKNDIETLCMHLAHQAWNNMAAIEHLLTGQMIDDRYKPSESERIDLDKLMELSQEQQEVMRKLRERKK